MEIAYFVFAKMALVIDIQDIIITSEYVQVLYKTMSKTTKEKNIQISRVIVMLTVMKILL